MTRFQLVFRGADGDQSEYRFKNMDGEPHIDGRLVVDGEAYVIRDVEWLLRREDRNGGMPRFVCALVAPSEA
jgi:hypothetical protein